VQRTPRPPCPSPASIHHQRHALAAAWPPQGVPWAVGGPGAAARRAAVCAADAACHRAEPHALAGAARCARVCGRRRRGAARRSAAVRECTMRVPLRRRGRGAHSATRSHTAPPLFSHTPQHPRL
jgi:hypothetical protein